ncbi:MAG TPA: Rab family GTPase [Thermoplasmata archaeon]|nr:Rab family GTPase [Thermoplasmata archaeon]
MAGRGTDQPIKFKICLVGPMEVGKSSLLHRFAYDQFSDRYLSTLGMKVAKKSLVLETSEGPSEITLIIYDIMGQRSLRDSLKQAYFQGAQGVLAVCDITRDETLDELEEWVRTAKDQAGDVPVVFLGNKCDLRDRLVIHPERLRDVADRHAASHFLTSAKTAENVEASFRALALAIAARGGLVLV